MTRKKIEVIPVERFNQQGLFELDENGRMHTPGVRTVYKYPEAEIAWQREALAALRSLEVPMPLATGSIPGLTLLDNVKRHIEKRDLSKGLLWCLADFTDAFGRVNQQVMVAKMEALMSKYAQGSRHRQARSTIRSYLEDGAFFPLVKGVGVPQGNATSADFYNLYMLEADLEIDRMLKRSIGNRATRYLDDLTVSGPDDSDEPGSDPPLSRRFCRSVRDIYRKEAPGMDFAPGKSKYLRLGPGSPAVTITGLSVYPDGRITPGPDLIENAKEVFTAAEKSLAEGVVPTPRDIGEVAGHLGALNLAGETSHSGSRAIRRMGQQGHRLVKLMKQAASQDSVGHQDYY